MILVNNSRKEILALGFRILGLLVGLTAIILQYVCNANVSEEFMVNHTLAYFTMQTNIITTVVFFYLIIKTITESIKNKHLALAKINPNLELATTAYITITLLGFWLALAPIVGPGFVPLTIMNNLFIHTFTPLMAILDALLFMPHGSLKSKDAIKWLAYPILYLIFVLIFANTTDTYFYKIQMDGKIIELMYPYPFLDPQIVGIWGMIGIIIFLFIFFSLFSLLYIYLDNKLAKLIAKRRTISQ